MKILKIFLALNIIFVGFSFGQTKIDRTKAISVVENLYYDEFYLGDKVYFKIDIDYSEQDEHIEITETAFFSDDQKTKTKSSFYLEDIDVTSMIYDLYESEPGLFFVTVQFNAKGKSIEVNTVEIDKAKFSFPISDTKYVDILRIAPVAKALPKSLANKFIENAKILIGAESYQKATLFH